MKWMRIKSIERFTLGCEIPNLGFPKSRSRRAIISLSRKEIEGAVKSERRQFGGKFQSRKAEIDRYDKPRRLSVESADRRARAPRVLNSPLANHEKAHAPMDVRIQRESHDARSGETLQHSISLFVRDCHKPGDYPGFFHAQKKNGDGASTHRPSRILLMKDDSTPPRPALYSNTGKICLFDHATKEFLACVCLLSFENPDAENKNYFTVFT